MNLDRNDIKMTTVSTEFYYNGDNVTVELHATLKTPEVFTYVFGPFYKVVKATAKCRPGDAYDKRLGEKMALARAEAKAYRQLSNEIDRRWKYMLEALETLKPVKDAFQEKSESSIDHNAKYVDELPRG